MVVSNANGNEKLKLDSVVGAILDEESRRKVSQVAEASGSALRVEARGRDVEKGGDKHRQREKSRGPNPKGHGKGACFRCGQKGHYASACRTKLEDDDSEESANIAYQDDSEALLLSLEEKIDGWVLDSGDSFHATSDRGKLSLYVEEDLGALYPGDSESYTISGIGDGE